MTEPQDDELFHLSDAPAPPGGGRWVAAGLGAVLVVLVVGLAFTLMGSSGPAGAAPHTLSEAGAGAPVTGSAAPASTGGSSATASTTTAAARSTGAMGTVIPTPAAPDAAKDTSTPMPAAERAAAEAELRAFVAAHLQSALSLTSPVDWVGKDPDQPAADGIATCPHLADRLAAELGGRWTYTQGSLPTFGGCTWTPVPWVPEADPTLRYFEMVGFVPGADIRSSDSHVLYQAAGTQCPEIDAPAVAPGAFAARCQDPDDLEYDLVLPDAGGRGVWYLRTYAGHAQQGATAQEGLLGLIAAVRAVY
jgi:hypothetical protein